MDPMFEPLAFRNLTVKNRIFRSNVSGQFDHYDGSGGDARIQWELKFARGGVGAIISSFVPVSLRGRIAVNYGTIHRDEFIPFWRELGERVHEYDCRFIMQLSHAGRQRDLPTAGYPRGLSSTGKPEQLHGFECDRMTRDDIAMVVREFAEGARRAREAGLDGVELHGANGYLITQFLSSGINDRDDEYGGSLENRARFVREIVRAIRAEVGNDFHLQMKINGSDHNDALFPWEKKGNTIEETVQICRMLEEDGVDAFHVSSGSLFPHPRNPAGGLPMDTLRDSYGPMSTAGKYTLRNLILFRMWPTGPLFGWWWRFRGGRRIEGISLADAQRVKSAVKVPVICTGGFQTASVVNQAIHNGNVDAVSIARSLIANNNLVQLWEQGLDRPPIPCTYCNKCLVNGTRYPLACYEQSRFPSPEAMYEQAWSVFQPLDPTRVGK